MLRTLVSGNVAADTAGGIEDRGILTLTDSLVDGNSSGDDGGGLQTP